MPDILGQAAGLACLIGGVMLGYRRWVAPRRSALDPAQRGLLLLVIVTLVGGGLGSPFWWLDVALSFAWDLPPLAGRMLAAAAWAFVALSLAALQHPTPDRLRLFLVMLAVYLGPLTAAILLQHRDRFDPRAPITPAFFSIVAGMLAPTLWFLARPPRPIAASRAEAPPPPFVTACWLGAVALISGLWGLALFLTDAGPSALIWAWPGDLLTSRLIGVMLLTIAAGAAASLRHADRARIALLATLVYALGITLAAGWGLVVGQPARPGYALGFAGIALGSGYLLAAARLAPAEPGAAPTR